MLRIKRLICGLMICVTVGLTAKYALVASGEEDCRESPGNCPADCDCETPKSATGPCKSSLEGCEDRLTEAQCGLTSYYVNTGWPTGCKANKYIAYMGPEKFLHTNCNEEATPCYKIVTCQWNQTSGTCTIDENVPGGPWENENKKVERCCPTK
jgi:hypothetical protein